MANKTTATITPPKGRDALSTTAKQPPTSTSWASTPPIVTTKSNTLSDTLSNTLSKASPLLVASPLLTASPQSNFMMSILKYTLLIILLIFLILTLVLYLIKPDSTNIVDIYDPIITFFYKKKDTTQTDVKLESIINDKPTDTSVKVENTHKDGEDVIELIPVSNDTDDPIQSQYKAKSGSCYIGTDKGFRNCVSIDEGDKCMSGDIFPTLEMCINPKLRE